MAPPRLLMANWKMNLGITESCALARSIAKSLSHPKTRKDIQGSVQIVLAPSFTALDAVSRVASRSKAFYVGAQDCFWKDQGAYTGEESVSTLEKIGVTYVLIGHSERREYFSESNETIRKKIEFVFHRKIMTPVLCIGENHSQKISGKRKSILQQQLVSALKGLFQHPLEKHIVIAYEPVWAIGTGVSATAHDCAEAYSYLNGLLENAWGSEAVSRLCRIIYGGSVSETNILDYVSSKVSDGALIGGASLTASGFSSIVKRVLGSPIV